MVRKVVHVVELVQETTRASDSTIIIITICTIITIIFITINIAIILTHVAGFWGSRSYFAYMSQLLHANYSAEVVKTHPLVNTSFSYTRTPSEEGTPRKSVPVPCETHSPYRSRKTRHHILNPATALKS